jgi:hypothetical protein
MSIRDKILSEQSETMVEKTAAAEKLKSLLHKLDKKVVDGVVGMQNVIDPEDSDRREKEGPDTMSSPLPRKSPPKRPGEDRRSTTEEIEKLAEMLGKGVERHRGTDVPKKYSPEKGGTEADRKRLGRKAKKGEKIVNLSRDLRAKISTDEAVEDMTAAQERDRDHKDNPTRKTVAKVKLPSTKDERNRYAKDFRVKRGYGTGVGNKQRKLKDLTLKDSTEFADSVMQNLGEASPRNRSTLKLQPIRRYTTNVSPDLRGKPQQHGGPGPDSVTSTDDQKARMDRLRGTYPMPDGTTLKREIGDKVKREIGNKGLSGGMNNG